MIKVGSNWNHSGNGHLCCGAEFILVLDSIERLYAADVLVSVQLLHHSLVQPARVSASVLKSPDPDDQDLMPIQDQRKTMDGWKHMPFFICNSEQLERASTKIAPMTSGVAFEPHI